MASTHRGVFCIEGPWSTKLTDRSSVRPLLDLLDSRSEAKFAIKDASTVEELQKYLTQWRQSQYRKLSIGYFAFHGEPGGIVLGQKFVALEEIGEMLDGGCSERVIHIDACKTLDIPPKNIEAFRRQTGATAVTGFTKEVDWMHSASFAINLFYELAPARRVPDALKRFSRQHAGACRDLGFRAVWANGRIGIPGRVG